MTGLLSCRTQVFVNFIQVCFAILINKMYVKSFHGINHLFYWKTSYMYYLFQIHNRNYQRGEETRRNATSTPELPTFSHSML